MWRRAPRLFSSQANQSVSGQFPASHGWGSPRPRSCAISIPEALDQAIVSGSTNGFGEAFAQLDALLVALP
jgi:hypothetical protein